MLIKAVALFDQKYRKKQQYCEILFKLLNKLYFIHKIILKKVSQVPKNKMFPTWIINQHISMISERSRDTEDWSKDAESFAFQE